MFSDRHRSAKSKILLYIMNKIILLLVPLLEEDKLVKAMLYYCDNLSVEKAYSDYRKGSIDGYSAEKVVHVHADALTLASR